MYQFTPALLTSVEFNFSVLAKILTTTKKANEMMRGTKYSTLHQDDQQQRENQQQEDEEKQRKADRMERINVKATALAWVVVGCLIAYYSDIVHIGMSDDRVNRWAFNIAVVSFMCNFCIMIYVTVWVSFVATITFHLTYCLRIIYRYQRCLKILYP